MGKILLSELQSWYNAVNNIVNISKGSDSNNQIDLTESFTPTSKTLTTIQLNNNTPYLYYRWTNIEAMNGDKDLNTLQFYG